MRTLPPLSAIRAFEAAARHKNYTRAGEELGLTQAGVSYQIRNLEQRVGTVLFVRNGRSMELTPAGEALAPRISQAFTSMESAFASLGESEDTVLSIACFQTFATKILAPRLGKFQLEHPEIAVRLDVSDRFVDLEAGECDIAIRLSNEVPAGLVSHFLMRLGVAPFASPAFIERHADLRAADPSILDAYRISPGNAWWQIWDDARCADRAGQDDGAGLRGLQFDSQVLDGAAAASGDGVALVASTLFTAEIENGTLQRVGSAIVWPGPKFRLVYPEVRRHSAKVRAFRNWLIPELESLFADNPDGVMDPD